MYSYSNINENLNSLLIICVISNEFVFIFLKAKHIIILLTSLTYFSAGFKIKGIGYFKRYVKPTALLLTINIVEDFIKPLSLNFRLFGNILADELTVTVLCSLVPIFVPVPIMVLGLFASSVQALIFATLAAAYIGEVIE